MKTENAVIAFPLADGRWLALRKQEFDAALRRAADLNLNAAATPVVATAPERLLNSRQLAAVTGVGDVTLEGLAKRGEIPSVRIGKALRFKPSAVLTALQTRSGNTFGSAPI
jgi:excisionase family DNA binding protein